MKIRQSMTVGLILLTSISFVSVNEVLSQSLTLIKQEYDAHGRLRGLFCNEHGQCRWILMKHPKTSPSKKFKKQMKIKKSYSPPPQNRSKNNADNNSFCNLCERCRAGSLGACSMVSGADCKRCKKISESDNRNIDRMHISQQCTLSKASCSSACGTIPDEYGKRLCRKKCELEYKECLSTMK